MAAQPEELERRIAEPRERLRRDVDELVERVSPSAVAHRQVARVRPAVDAARERLTPTPVRVGIGAGVAATVAALVAVRRFTRR